MEDIAERLEARDRHRRRRWLTLTPDERVDEMLRLQASNWATLLSSPTGYAHYIRKNHRKRAVQTAGETSAQ